VVKCAALINGRRGWDEVISQSGETIQKQTLATFIPSIGRSYIELMPALILVL
jgi:hypothetical protein